MMPKALNLDAQNHRSFVDSFGSLNYMGLFDASVFETFYFNPCGDKECLLEFAGAMFRQTTLLLAEAFIYVSILQPNRRKSNTKRRARKNPEREDFSSEEMGVGCLSLPRFD